MTLEQRDHQKTCEFAAYLNQWEVSAPKHTQKIQQKITSGQESSKTCDMEALTPTDERYEGYIAHLKQLRFIPAMRHGRRPQATWKDNKPSSQQGPEQATMERATIAPLEAQWNPKVISDSDPAQPDMECYVCGERDMCASMSQTCEGRQPGKKLGGPVMRAAAALGLEKIKR
ncbi:uncharacterized protein ATNIH1004_002061 [Aspergillus tanneri]|uniref:Uncharacterized protein n=1 Tax=Aspergillus tanneri TaxID=1220188 RepID=A0A5M9M703_9EURO|nr:uncharacterized protein ATNIH1004_002061 [Aspergillus tanneri]KAA8641260.1 hypothetical protein ATNIH1004_002061 [Aspergillus tanneri]